MSVFQIIVEPVNKRTMQLSMDYIEMLERRYFRSGKSSLAFLDEDIRSLTITFPMLPFNPFYEEFEEKIQRLIEAGTCPKRLIGRIVASTSENKRFNEDVPPLVLTLDDLGIGFVACLVPLGLSIIVFVIEISASKLRQLQNYLKAVFRWKTSWTISFIVLKTIVEVNPSFPSRVNNRLPDNWKEGKKEFGNSWKLIFRLKGV